MKNPRGLGHPGPAGRLHPVVFALRPTDTVDRNKLGALVFAVAQPVESSPRDVAYDRGEGPGRLRARFGAQVLTRCRTIWSRQPVPKRSSSDIRNLEDGPAAHHEAPHRFSTYEASWVDVAATGVND